MPETSDRRKLQRVVPRKKNDQAVVSPPPEQDTAATATDQTANASTIAVATDADFPTLPEQPVLESTDSSRKRKTQSATPSKLRSRDPENVERQKRTVNVRCKNCQTRFQFRTHTDIRYRCRECGESIQISLQRHKQKKIVLLAAVLVVGAAVSMLVVWALS